MQSLLVSVPGGKGTNPKNVLYVGGLEENVNEAILHSAFIAFGDIKDVNIPLDNTTGDPPSLLHQAVKLRILMISLAVHTCGM